MPQSVLFVSKPIGPPFHDGSKCLVRDVARNLTRIEPIVMSTRGAPPLVSAHHDAGIRSVHAYGVPGGFTPAFTANLRAAAWLLVASRADVWHFVFAPNARTSQAGRFLKRIRRVPVVQTVASPPRSFERPETLFFGDVLVAQSSWTRDAIQTSYEAAHRSMPRIAVIPPPAPEIAQPSAADIEQVRRELNLPPNARYLIYPGDLETSSGAEVCAAIAEQSASVATDLVTVFAYRNKSDQSRPIAAGLASRLPPARARFVENAPNILALLAGAAAVVFPVDDLWGKVDLPIVLLEAMQLGVPVLSLDRGPLADLSGVVKVADLDVHAWLGALSRVLEPGAAEAIAHAERSAIQERHLARLVAGRYEDLYLQLLARTSGKSVPER